MRDGSRLHLLLHAQGAHLAEGLARFAVGVAYDDVLADETPPQRTATSIAMVDSPCPVILTT